MLMFGEIMIAEYLDKENIIVSFNSQADGINLNSLSIILFGILLITAFIKCSFNGHIGDTAYFFGGLNIFAGFYYSASSTALSIFFAAAGITILIGLIKDTNYALKYDLLTGLPSRRYYLKDSQKFPFKYSLAVICLDNYVHLVKILGYFKTQKLIRMLANRLSELEPENPVYRYSTHEFILIFKNETLKNSFERLEQIRKEIASTEFMFSPKQKGLKITISACVSEKKRNDANATEVLVRAHRMLEKAYQFTQNMISKA